MDNKDSEKIMIAHWDKMVEYYNALYTKKTPGMIHRFRRFAEVVPDDKEYRIIDAGCGNGYLFSYLLKKGHDVFGFDISPKMVELVQQNLKKDDLDIERVTCSDISYLDKIETSSVDYVMASGLMRYLSKEDGAKVYKNVHRILKDDGFFVATYTNKLFDLWTFNRHTIKFFIDNIMNFEPIKDCFDKQKIIQEIRKLIVNTELPSLNPDSIRDKNLATLHNPLTIRDYLKKRNFEVLDLRFYSWHPLPPLLKEENEKEYQNAESAIEMFDDRNWRGYFMAYEFLVHCKKG